MMTNDSKDQGREAFEAWITDADIGDLAFGRDGECYVDWDTQVAWRGYKAALATSASALARDEASVALTDEQIIDIWCNTPTTRFGGEVEDQEIIDFASVLLDASPAASSAATVSDARDAARYRWLRDQDHSLETRQRDKCIVNGPSCYHDVEGIRELKWGDDLDKAIDAAIAASSATAPLTSDSDAPVDAFLAEVRAELIRARAKFPGDRIMTIALAEEFGELCKAVLDECSANVRKEAVQTAVMCARVVLDGDGSVNDWRAERGLDPLVTAQSTNGEQS
jgi:hypothetical protein